jgi:hypothetical protein
MTGAEMNRIRTWLGLSQAELACWLDLARGGATRVREMETGVRPVTGPIGVAMEAFAAGWRPGMKRVG